MSNQSTNQHPTNHCTLSTEMLDAKEEIIAQTYNLFTSLHVRLDAMERQLLAVTSDVASKGVYAAHPTYINVTTYAPGGGARIPAPTTTSTAGANTTTVVRSTSPSQFGHHTPLHMTRSVPGAVAEVAMTSGLPTPGFYEPRREFVSRRWSYYQDRSRRSERYKASPEQVLPEPPSTHRKDSVRSDKQGRQLQQQQDPDHHPQLYRQMATTSDHSPPRQQFREDNSSVRRQSRRQSDYSPVRYAEGKGHSPVRLQDRPDFDERLVEQTELREQQPREKIRDKVKHFAWKK